MRTLLIVHHSMTGGTRQMAEAAARGAASEPELRVRLLAAPDARPGDVLAADGYLFATPENLAAVSGLLKDFFDRTYYPALGRIEGRPYAALVCAGSDGGNAARQILRVCTGWRLKPVAEPLIVRTHAQTPCLLGLFSVVALLAGRLGSSERSAAANCAWYRKRRPTFTDTLAAVRRHLWCEQGLLMSRRCGEPAKPRPALRNALAYAICHAA